MSYYTGKRDTEKQRISRYIIKYAKKIKLIQLKGGKCKICGISDLSRPWIYQFHHLDKTKKEFGIHELNGVSFSRMKKEAEKCICVCENCHKQIHSDEIIIDKTTANKLMFLEYKKTDCCEKCGYKECIKSLDFHHMSSKEFELADIISQQSHKKVEELKEIIEKELDKCAVVCGNCHRDIHSNIDMFNKYKKKIFEKVKTIKDTYANKVNHNKVLKLNKDGLSQQKISEKLGCGISTVCEILKSNGIHTHIKMKILDVKRIIELRKQGKTNSEIAKILDCHRFSIPHAIRRYKSNS
jgi:DNA-binding CsgD family transcriptional regulator